MKLIEIIENLKNKRIIDEKERLKNIKEATDLNEMKAFSCQELKELESLYASGGVMSFVIIKILSNIKNVDMKDISLADLSLFDEKVEFNKRTMSDLFISLLFYWKEKNIEQAFKEYNSLSNYWKNNKLLAMNLINFFAKYYSIKNNFEYLKYFNKNLLNDIEIIECILYADSRLLLSKKYSFVRALFDENKIKELFLNSDFRDGIYDSIVENMDSFSVTGISRLYDELDIEEIEIDDLVNCIYDSNLAIFKRKDIIEKFKNNERLMKLLNSVSDEIFKEQLEMDSFEVIKDKEEWIKIKNMY